MLQKIKTQLWTLPRWFALPFFGASVILGCIIAGATIGSLHLWLAFIAVILTMAGGHSFNSYLDYNWTKLDQGEVDVRSAEKDYAGGQNLIEKKMVSLQGVFQNAVAFYILSAVPVIILCIQVTPWVLLPWTLGIGSTPFCPSFLCLAPPA